MVLKHVHSLVSLTGGYFISVLIFSPCFVKLGKKEVSYGSLYILIEKSLLRF